MQYTPNNKPYKFTLLDTIYPKSSFEPMKRQPNVRYYSLLVVIVFAIRLPAQNAGIELTNASQFSFINNTNYKTTSSNDTRLGLIFGDFESLSFGMFVGKNNFKSQTTTPMITSNIELNYVTLDLPLNYKFGKAINSISVGPSLYLNTYSSQTNNNLIVRNSKMFKGRVFGLYVEITTKGWTSNNAEILPFVFIRKTIGGIENEYTNENINLYQLGLGLKFKLIWL